VVPYRESFKGSTTELPLQGETASFSHKGGPSRAFLPGEYSRGFTSRGNPLGGNNQGDTSRVFTPGVVSSGFARGTTLGGLIQDVTLRGSPRGGPINVVTSSLTFMLSNPKVSPAGNPLHGDPNSGSRERVPPWVPSTAFPPLATLQAIISRINLAIHMYRVPSKASNSLVPTRGSLQGFLFTGFPMGLPSTVSPSVGPLKGFPCNASNQWLTYTVKYPGGPTSRFLPRGPSRGYP
jgi:hypothetical protein